MVLFQDNLQGVIKSQKLLIKLHLYQIILLKVFSHSKYPNWLYQIKLPVKFQ
ncbi:hypothetical protein O3M35_002580 [Rhynocoris fuscipes]|uniref:Uncharacterized protein n=1 Tax=Rhynocoris fuscipes TaxID=488301 RepID=A0AAW1CPV7_9HEMI